MLIYIGIFTECILFAVLASAFGRRELINVAAVVILLAVYLAVRIGVAGRGLTVIFVRLCFSSAFLFVLCQLPARSALFMGILFSFLLHLTVIFYSNLGIGGVMANGVLSVGGEILTFTTQLLLVLLFRKYLKDADGLYFGLGEGLLLAFSFIAFLVIADQEKYLMESPEQVRITMEAVCVSALLALFAVVWHMSWRAGKTRTEQLEEMLTQQYAVWNERTERDETIRRMYHDMKHQIELLSLAGVQDAQQMGASLNEQLGAYSIVPSSGNAVLDTILNEKARECRSSDVRFYLEESTDSVDYIDAMDLCAMLGNALDNAIRAATEAQEEDRRYVRLKILRQPVFLAISVENGFDGEVRFRNGNPLTKKKDGGIHGVGISSIRYAADRYGGQVTLETASGVFRLKIVLPVPDAEKTAAGN